MRTLILSLALLAGASAPAFAQGADTAATSAMAVVKSLFDGMRAGDSARVRAAFHPRAQLATTTVRAGVPVVTFDSLAAFYRAVGTPHAETWDERLHGETIAVDAGMASVWAPYTFYRGTTLSHCGVNTFQLARTAAGWKIIALVDTRQRTGCTG
jgi:hypothetical protein